MIGLLRAVLACLVATLDDVAFTLLLLEPAPRSPVASGVQRRGGRR